MTTVTRKADVIHKFKNRLPVRFGHIFLLFSAYYSEPDLSND